MTEPMIRFYAVEYLKPVIGKELAKEVIGSMTLEEINDMFSKFNNNDEVE